MVDGVAAQRAGGAGDDAVAAAWAADLDHVHDPGLRVRLDRLGVDGAGAQAGGPLAVLAGDGEEVERRARRGAQPDDLVAVLAGAEPMLLLARRLAALAADAAFEVDHQGEAPHAGPPTSR